MVLPESPGHQKFWNSAFGLGFALLSDFYTYTSRQNFQNLHLMPRALIIPQIDNQLDETEDQAKNSYVVVSRSCIDSEI